MNFHLVMNQIFYIHSPITLLAAIGTINRKGIEKGIFVLSTDFQPNKTFIPGKVQIFRMNNQYLEKSSSEGSWSILKNLSELLKFRYFVKSLGEKHFEVYLPHTKNFLMQCWINHPNCKKYHIIEEGLLSYNHPDQFIKKSSQSKTPLNKLKNWLLIPKHLNQSVAYRRKNIELGTIFLFYSSPYEMVYPKFETIQFPNFADVELDYSNHTIFILDNAVEAELLSQNEYEEWLQKQIEHYHFNSIYIKFHPRQKNQNQILQVFARNKINIQILHPEVYLELVFRKSKNLKVYGLWSSLLYYARKEGHQVFSGISDLNSTNETLPVFLKLLPNYFKMEINGNQ